MNKIKLERERFADRLSKAANFLPDKQIIPAFENFLFVVKPLEQLMVISASNGAIDVHLTCHVTVNFKETYGLCVPAKLVMKTVKLLRDNEVTINIKAENLIEIVSGKSKYKIALDTPVDAFPLITPAAAVAEITMNQGILKMGLQGAEDFVDADNQTEQFRGINIAEIGGRIIFTGCISSLMCRVSTRPLSINVWKSVIINPDTAGKVIKLLNDDKAECTVTHSGDKIYFRSESFYVSASTANIKFPNTENIFAKMPSNVITMSTMEVLQAAKRLKLYSGVDQIPLVKMVTSAEDALGPVTEVVMTAEDTNIGNAGEEIIDALTVASQVVLDKKHFTDEVIKVLAGIAEVEFHYHFSDQKNIPSFIIPKVAVNELNMFSYLIACVS